ncbi:hypothetical protein BP5796_00662 [Coleophoma crateriformis]|uniref:Peptidase S33 tripeptidyl aminopeptidase-like C-terminal domain-containing protein n=1 Tax=Coleophoma crateriformis TaxID=565419 RepID=A0A3D8T8K3_9HELO|nr:hypothetical protein BP5796_00662 [Coleophoma crateriformis]
MSKDSDVHTPLLVPPVAASKSLRPKWKVYLAVLFLVLCYGALPSPSVDSFLGSELKKSDDRAFRWSDITPNKQLQYTECFGGFQCTRLDVPLNWNASSIDGGPRAAVAIVRLPAKVPVTDERYGGALLMNPGGPGESGIHQVLSGGKFIQDIIDSPDPSSGKYFDIIGFDPRGVNNTTPRLRCFPDAFNQQSWSLKYPDYGMLWDAESIIGFEWARAESLGGSCARVGDDEDMVRFINTAQVVEDMVEIVERHAEWREMEAREMVAQSQSRFSHPHEDSEKILQRTAWRKGQEKILYWGFSYGTTLGSTFAAMHPDRVGRLLIDGVMDVVDYYTGGWATNLVDADMIITKYCEYCYQAGPEKCSFFTGTSGKDVEARLDRVMQDLKRNPIAVPASGSRGPEIVTFGDVYLRMLSAMYFPYGWAEGFFDLLTEVEAGNGTSVAELKQSALAAVEISLECEQDGPFSDACVAPNYISGMGTVNSISCMDAGGFTNITKEGFRDYLVALEKQSKRIFASWARGKISCLGYNTAPAYRFPGPIAGNTSHPMLIIGNTHDTVTPIRNARYIASQFPGAVVLHHDSQGHCSYSNPSICTAKVIREYFQTGALPEIGTMCTPQWRPFLGCTNKDEAGNCKLMDKEDEKLFESQIGLTQVWP